MTLDFATTVLRVQGNATLAIGEASIGGRLVFEQTTRTNGTKVMKIGIFGLKLVLGNEADGGFKLEGGDGMIFVTNLGMAAEFSVPVNIAFGGDAFVFSGTLSLGINNTNAAVNEIFDVGDGTTKTLTLPKGPYIRLAGSQITVTILGHSVKGDFVFDSTTKANGQKVTRVAALNVSADFGDPTYGSVSLRNGKAGFVFLPVSIGGGGVAGTISGDFTANGGPLQIQGQAVLEINTTSVLVDETVKFDTGNVRINLTAKLFRVGVRNLSIKVGDFFELTGDFVFDDSTPGEIAYGAKNVTIFMGSDGVGIQITGATVGVIRKLNGAGDLDDTYAVYAFGKAELVGFPGVTVVGTLRVRINQTGVAYAKRSTCRARPPRRSS